MASQGPSTPGPAPPQAGVEKDPEKRRKRLWTPAKGLLDGIRPTHAGLTTAGLTEKTRRVERNMQQQRWCDEAGCSNEVAPGRKKCQQCINEIRKLKQYGLDDYDYGQKCKAQDGKCAICRLPETQINVKTGKPQRLSIDHDHKTGRVRNLLCARCNQAIGLMKDDPQRLRSAAEYLERWNPKVKAA